MQFILNSDKTQTQLRCNSDYNTGEQNKKKIVWNISPDSTLLGVTNAQMQSLFSQSGQVFPQFWAFEAIFEARRENFQIFKNIDCTFYCTQNDHLDPTVSMQKSV